MATTAQGADPARWQDILLALADIDAGMAAGTGIKAGILANLRPGWLKAADDGSPELRLALALAAQYGVRHHWLPLDKSGRRLATTDEGRRLAHDPRVVCFGRDLLADAVALVSRRLVESTQSANGTLDLAPVHLSTTADLRDIAAFLQGGLDHGRILRLARAFMMLDMAALRAAPPNLRTPIERRVPVDDAYAMLRFCLLPKYCTDRGRWMIPVQPSIYRRLAAGDLPTAIRMAAQHLRAHGLVPPILSATGDPNLLAASMAFPISCSSRDELFQAFVTTNQTQGEQA
jgi:CRISPR-associated protein Csx17